MAFAIFCAISVHTHAAQTRALLIGINDYTASGLARPNAKPVLDRDYGNLAGAIRDVKEMTELVTSTYQFNDVVTLTDQQATHDAIVKAMERLVASTKQDDVVFFYYSGHGSQVFNSLSEEDDKLDESIVPADSRLGAPDIRDKTLRNWFNKILDRGARLTVFIDACHSASGIRGLPTGERARFVTKDENDAADPSKGPRPEHRGALVLAATEDFDDAFEVKDENKQDHGAFTWAFLRALRDSNGIEPVSDTFLRAQARLHAVKPAQNPFIAGTPATLGRAFLGERADRVKGRPRIAVEKDLGNDTYRLSGGWISGITVGSELQLAGRNDVRLEVRKLVGVGHAEAQLVPRKTRGIAKLESGALLEILTWAPPPARPLRIWIPDRDDNALRSAQQLREDAAQRGIQWIHDPTENSPTHLLRWRNGGWELIADGNVSRPSVPLATVPRRASLFVQLPAPAAFAETFTGMEGIEWTNGPEAADYILAGRLGPRSVEYAFLRPHADAHDADRAPLPLRTAWRTDSAGLLLRDSLMRLQRVHAWHDVQSPAAWQYALAICQAKDGTVVDDRQLIGGIQYQLLLRMKPSPKNSVFTRYVYAFVIDSAGTSKLVFPRSIDGPVENRLPLNAEPANPVKDPPAELALDASHPFRIGEPYGADTYFVLTTDEPLASLDSLQWSGVRGDKSARAPGTGPQSPLERLLERTLSGARAPGDEKPARIPPNWSLEKVIFQSVAPRRTRL